MLQSGGYKKYNKTNGWITSVAHEMGTGATFHGIAKNSHPAYEAEVLNYLRNTLGATNAVMPTNRPGWTCTGTSSASQL
jgi:hypothetical protein